MQETDPESDFTEMMAESSTLEHILPTNHDITRSNVGPTSQNSTSAIMEKKPSILNLDLNSDHTAGLNSVKQGLQSLNTKTYIDLAPVSVTFCFPF